MPAAGKCRKGVLEMKKLLLLLLVPVLVLGVMVGCGKVYDGDVTPYILQGAWVADNGGPNLIISGNQITVMHVRDITLGNVAFRTNYSGDSAEDLIDNNGTSGTDYCKLEFYWFSGSNDLIGSFEFSVTLDPDDFTNDEITVELVKYEDPVHNVMLPKLDTVYTRLLQSSF
jgi:hypothetical protein